MVSVTRLHNFFLLRRDSVRAQQRSLRMSPPVLPLAFFVAIHRHRAFWACRPGRVGFLAEVATDFLSGADIVNRSRCDGRVVDWVVMDWGVG